MVREQSYFRNTAAIFPSHDGVLHFYKASEVVKTLTDLGDLAVLLPLAVIVTVWLVTLRQPRALAWWVAAVAFCIGSTALLKIYFFVCPPTADLHSPSGHTSLSTLVYGAVTLAIATAVSGWKRVAVLVSGAVFVAAVGVSRVIVEAHSILEVAVGLTIGMAALGLFASQFWPRRPVEPRLRALLIACITMMVMLNGQDLRAEDMLHAIGIYLRNAGMACF